MVNKLPGIIGIRLIMQRETTVVITTEDDEAQNGNINIEIDISPRLTVGQYSQMREVLTKMLASINIPMPPDSMQDGDYIMDLTKPDSQDRLPLPGSRKGIC